MIEPVPLHLAAIVRAWQCQKRGLCCRIHRVQVDVVEQRRITRALTEAGDPHVGQIARLAEIQGLPVLPMRDDAEHGPTCVFLDAERLCTLRTRFGESVYPQICKLFPFLSLLTPDRQLVSLSLQCPTALELFLRETHFERLIEPDGIPPVDRVAPLASDDIPYYDAHGERLTCRAFWAKHWTWFDRFASAPEADPFERVANFTRAVTGDELPARATLSGPALKNGVFDSAVMREVELLAGVAPRGLWHLWGHPPAQPHDLPDVACIDEQAILTRYLIHRFFVSPDYMIAPDLGIRLVALWATLLRWRIERARHPSPVMALRNLDRFFVHSGALGAVFDRTTHAWRAVASLARAVIIG